MFHRPKWIGRDHVFLEIIARILNATFTIIEPEEGSRYEGAYSDMINGRTHFCFVRTFRAEANKNISLSYTQADELATLDVLVPKPKLMDKYKVFFKIFKIRVWIGLSLSLIGVASCTYCVIKKDFYKIALDTWGVMLQCSVKVKQYFRIRSALTAWIWATLILYVYFQAILMELMQFPLYDVKFRNLDDVTNSDLSIFTSYNVSTLLLGYDRVANARFKRIKHMDIKRNIDGGVSGIYAMAFAQIRGKANPDLFLGTSNFDILSTPLLYGAGVYAFPRRSPYRNVISKKIIFLKETGLTTRVTQMQFGSKIANEKVATKMGLYHLQACFIFLVFGYAISGLGFLIEMLRPGKVTNKNVTRAKKNLKKRENFKINSWGYLP